MKPCRKKLKFELKKRSKDDLEFEDEVDYPADVSLRDRFKKYKGLKNFRTAEWKKTVLKPIPVAKGSVRTGCPWSMRRYSFTTNTSKP